jgi:cysteine desulfurase
MTETRTYLDYNATAPLRAEARQAMVDCLDVTGNASSVHQEGRAARAVIEHARAQIAAFANANPSEVVFTSGGTEANNWFAKAGWDRFYVSKLEHDAMLQSAQASGSEVVSLAADASGLVAVEAFAADVLRSGATKNGRIALSLQLANNETGVVQPVAETAAFARAHGVMSHTDAVQAAGRMEVDFHVLGVDALSLSAHKIGGPKGVGALLVRDGVTLPVLMHGGAQERRRRAGTENIAAIAGFGAAAEAAQRELADLSSIQDLRALLECGLREVSPDVVIFGEGAPRLINTSCFAVPGLRAETALIKLDLAGVAVSTGSACSSGKVGSSHVLKAMSVPDELAAAAIRVSLGHGSTRQDIDVFLRAWKDTCGRDRIAA